MTNNLRKLELKERIQAAARRVFLAKGFSEAKMGDIASEAGVSPSTIYLYFSGKKDLFASLDIQHMADIRPEFDRKREDICRIALKIFGEEGFERTTMDAIAERAELSKAALYQYCSSKEDLFLQVLQYYISSGFHGPDGTRRDSDDWREHLRTVAKSCLNSARSPERSAFLGTVIRDSNKFPSFGAAYYQYSHCAARKELVRFLTLQQQRGLIRADADVPGITEVFLGSLMSYVVLYRIINGVTRDVDEQDYINNTVDAFVRALEP